ncbi:hypothetical protein N7541_001576 [Penicillium brevicompactum]|uniref:Uncharacterized protein n=1 Tax=Penicillium brevicompactum TaxID=5074 RepID=A0A9W9RXT3_PENBR|nr:hypothetical protein N7541_001576 [Penicillium brevicompactum]
MAFSERSALINKMFYRNGIAIHEVEPNTPSADGIRWVNVFLDQGDSRGDDLAIMHTIITCIHTRVVSITDHAMHHKSPLCLSIRVSGNHHNQESILAAAELSVEHLRSQVALGTIRINRDLLFRR